MQLPKIFILMLIAGFLTAGKSNVQLPALLSVNDFEKGIKQKNVQVLDVRTPDEYRSGHLKNALLADWMNQQEFPEKVQLLNKSKPVYTYCLVGGRSNEAAKWLTKKGFKVYNMEGGIAAWKRAGKTVEMINK